MNNFIVEKKVKGDVYTIKHTKTIDDVNGVPVTIVDRTEDITIKQLEEKKEGLQQQITDLQAQISEIDNEIIAMQKI